MSSVFISNCFIKTVATTINSISGTAIYRTEIGNFRELLFKGYFNNNKDDENIVNFNEKTLIILIGRFALEDNTEYVINIFLKFSFFFKLFLPFDETCNNPIISESVDTMDFKTLNKEDSINQFKNLTNLPHKLYLQEGARVMFLNNKLFDENICNSTIGIVTKIHDDNNVEVMFPTLTSINKIIVQKETSHFEIDGKRASRQ